MKQSIEGLSVLTQEEGEALIRGVAEPEPEIIELRGVFIGILPQSRRFEFVDLMTDEIIEGTLSSDVLIESLRVRDVYDIWMEDNVVFSVQRLKSIPRMSAFFEKLMRIQAVTFSQKEDR